MPRLRQCFTSSLCLILAAGCHALAAPVPPDQAHQAAQRWLQAGLVRPNRPMEQWIQGVREHRQPSGEPWYFEVQLAAGGFLLMSTDDELEPVLAFSESGTFDPSPDNPLAQLLHHDLENRRAERDWLRSTAQASPTGRNRWAPLLPGSSPEDQLMASLPSVPDLRVAPLVQSRWNQSKVAGRNVYNAFTPKNLVCGCVATAMAQLIRYHQYPVAGIGTKTFNISVEGLSQSATTRGGDGLGGPYVWTQMPLIPSATSTDAECQMIGALCYDAGVSVNMSYAATGSGSNMNASSRALVQTFKYSNSVCGSAGGELSGNGLLEMIQPNLDAGFPVLLGIAGNGGHAIVCDGYGFSGSPATLYHHLNLGWGGNSDAWYNLPDIGTNYLFNTVNACVYNVFPSGGGGDILSGRITDANGAPIPGVQITNGKVSATSNANGIYALTHVATGVQTLSATKAGARFPQVVRSIKAASNDGPVVGNLPNLNLVQNEGSIPTIWPQPEAQETLPGGTATFTVGATGVGPLHFQWFKNQEPVGTDSPTYTLTGATRNDDAAQIQVRVTGSEGEKLSLVAPLSVVYLINGGFEQGNSGWSLNGGAIKQGTLYSLVPPHSGKGWARLGDHATATTDSLTQKVNLPAEATRASLSFWMGIANDGVSSSVPTNVFTVKVLDATGTKLLQTLMTRDNTQASLDAKGLVAWKQEGPFDLSAYLGQSIQLRFESIQPGSSGSGTLFVLDDLSLPVSFGPVPATPLVSPSAWTLPVGGQVTFSAMVNASVPSPKVQWTSNPNQGSFTPAETLADGKSSTLFLAPTNPGNLVVSATPQGGNPGTSTLTLVPLSAVSVAITPNNASLSPGQALNLSAQVSPLSDPSVTWTCSGGSFSNQEATRATWSSSTVGTYTITASSSAAPSRQGSITVTVLAVPESLKLTPPDAVLLPGAALTLSASGAASVIWGIPGSLGTAPGGMSATLTAPTGAPLNTQRHLVSIQDRSDTTRRATATLTLKGMDLNGDGGLDAEDLLTLAQAWGRTSDDPANFKGQGKVDETDLKALMDQLKGNPQP